MKKFIIYIITMIMLLTSLTSCSILEDTNNDKSEDSFSENSSIFGNLLLGEWTGEQSGLPIYMEFYDFGVCDVKFNGSSRLGTYKSTEDSLTITFSSDDKQTTSYTIDGTTLSLIDANNVETVLTRVVDTSENVTETKNDDFAAPEQSVNSTTEATPLATTEDVELVEDEYDYLNDPYNPPDIIVGKPLNEYTMDEFIEMCQGYSYEDIARYPDVHEGHLANFYGKVRQVVDTGDEFILLVNVTYDLYWEDTIYVTAPYSDTGARILEGDMIDMYGLMAGLQSYEGLLGQTVTVPSLDCYYWFIY